MATTNTTQQENQPEPVQKYPSSWKRITIMAAVFLGIFLTTLVRLPLL
jgi:hypothetical protein